MSDRYWRDMVKVERVIKSCVTENHFNVARKYIDNFCLFHQEYREKSYLLSIVFNAQGPPVSE